MKDLKDCIKELRNTAKSYRETAEELDDFKDEKGLTHSELEADAGTLDEIADFLTELANEPETPIIASKDKPAPEAKATPEPHVEIKDGTPTCSECGSKNLILGEGSVHCMNCGAHTTTKFAKPPEKQAEKAEPSSEIAPALSPAPKENEDAITAAARRTAARHAKASDKKQGKPKKKAEGEKPPSSTKTEVV